MSDPTTPEAPTTANVLRGHLEAEVTALHVRRKRMAFTGIALVVIVLTYMTWLFLAVREFSKPVNLAAAAGGFVEANLPDAERAVENMVRTEVPRLVQFVGDTVVREAPARLRQMIEHMVLDYSRTLAMHAVKQFNEAFEAVLIGTRGDIDMAIKTEVDADRVRYVANAIEKQIEVAVNKIKTSEVGEEPLFIKLEQSHRALVNLNAKLRKMGEASATASTDRSEQLERRFLSTFWRFAQQQNPEVSVSK
ncbi:MAG: hypothetical protein EXR79_15885 [Myxococcales bacterium]|nr:hypothetical protein [Myxococcales bacterium]